MTSVHVSHWIVVALVMMLLFRRGRLTQLFEDMEKGVNAFRDGMRQDMGLPPAPRAPIPRERWTQFCREVGFAFAATWLLTFLIDRL